MAAIIEGQTRCLSMAPDSCWAMQSLEPSLSLLVLVMVGCSTIVLSVLYWLWATRPHVDAPGPPTLPIIGNILDFREVPLTIRKLRNLHRQYGDLTRFYFGPVLVMMVAHPDDVQHILLTSKQVERDRFTTGAVRFFIGDGLLTLEGSRWKAHRKLINPTFHSEMLEGFLEAFHEGGLFLSERFTRSKGAATEVYPPMLFITPRIICSTLLGVDPDLLIPDSFSEQELSVVVVEAMNTITRILVQPWMKNKFLLQLTSTGRAMLKYIQMLQDATKKCITIKSAATEEGATKTRLRLSEALIKQVEQTMMPLSEVQGELMNMILAGVETSSVATCFTMALLALHPDWQDAAQKELREVFGDGDDYLRGANMADLGRLRVLDSIIKETLRLFPTVALIPRVATEDLWLSKGRVLVPKGAVLVVTPFLTHRLPEFFPDPLKFDPSRFLEDRVGREHPCSYLPFGLGARNCVGSQYARLQLKVFLADILRRFRILPHSRWEDLEDTTFSISLHTIKPIKVSFVPLHEPNTQ